MKSSARALLFALATAALLASVVADGDWPGFPRRKRDSSANINDYMDRVLDQARVFLVDNHLEPYELDDKILYNLTFKLLLPWRTRLGLYGGEAQNLTTLRRQSDAELTYTSDARSLNLDATVAFDRLVINYKYADQLFNIGPHGTVKAILKNLTANLNIDVKLLSGKATLKEFKLNSAKSIKVDVTGLTFLGNLIVESFVNFFTLILKGPILKAVESQVTSALASAVNSTSIPFNLTVSS
ncbi:hypothetical protein R5R35_005825 [Gryllus longicercus]|uniref:Accessory gland protein n=1 Tax=Gryllus longicercus TaxID=2509291 RepID=A0AAN9V991_9ORTH